MNQHLRALSRAAANLRRVRLRSLGAGVALAGLAWALGGIGASAMAVLCWLAAMLGVTAVADATRRGPPDQRRGFLADLDHFLLRAAADNTATGCMVVQVDNAATFLDRHGRAAQTEVLRVIGVRLAETLRQDDRILPLEGGGFAIALAPARRLDLETLVQLAARLQSAAGMPVPVGNTRLAVSCSVGFCPGNRMQGRGAAALLDAAQIAADNALRNGPGALRAFAPGMARKRAERDARRADLELALDEGQIVAWFQPQVSTDTGAVTGFEALARWHHPAQGLIPPADFLPDIMALGLSERLSEVMVHHALVALARWDRAGLAIPCIGVNASADELRNPRFTDKLKWELDRFDLSPDRLAVEILETVIAETEHDMIVRNITALARLGCRIDLDDFGTGHSSIAHMRRFAVHRLKLDRSFVAGCDHDLEQQRMVCAILSMAERLGIDTLAEGVETPGELSVLAQLGCGHAQGYAIGRPMPFAAASDWLARREPPRLSAPGGDSSAADSAAITPASGRARRQ